MADKTTRVKIEKMMSTKHVLKGVVYKPGVKDGQGDWMSAEEIEKMAYLFMRRACTHSVDTSHNFQYVQAYICESYLAQENDPDGYPEGSWVVAVKIDDDETWSQIENGDFEAFSMAGLSKAFDNEPPDSF